MSASQPRNSLTRHHDRVESRHSRSPGLALAMIVIITPIAAAMLVIGIALSFAVAFAWRVMPRQSWMPCCCRRCGRVSMFLRMDTNDSSGPRSARE